MYQKREMFLVFMKRQTGSILLLLMEGNTATLENNGKSYHFTLQDQMRFLEGKVKRLCLMNIFLNIIKMEVITLNQLLKMLILSI